MSRVRELAAGARRVVSLAPHPNANTGTASQRLLK